MEHSVRGQGQELLPFQTSKESLKVFLLHGNLDIWIREAKNLPNMDMFHKTLGDIMGKLPLKDMCHERYLVMHMSRCLCGAVIARTFMISNSENTVWEQHFYVPVTHHAPEVQFVVKDNDGVFPILGANGKSCKQGAVLSISILYYSVALYQGEVGLGPDLIGLPGTYFPEERLHGKVTLYQDPHVHIDCLPKVKLDHNMKYEHGHCWCEIFDAISQACWLIYITGWSVYHTVGLVRDADDKVNYMLGDLLETKSQEGIRVPLLDCIMQTNDEETPNLFKLSSVKCYFEVGTIYTHHQKTVIVDADAGQYKRKIIAFVGGLDLCLGRYDTPNHPIFKTLQTEHKDEYHKPNFTGPTTGCPREPWHDLHRKIDGPAAYDILTNFEEHWLRASKPPGIKKT
ncbi:C2 domain [Dillenia turbinata]|uniref:phospholipase D n=1 Tax=Dillenia turbinata TaxID=194707 RepID=A0AAN8ZRS6_9MAGN